MRWLNLGYAEFRAPIDAMLLWAVGLSILAVWAAFSPRHWFIRALTLVLAIAAMLPIRANEPIVLFLVVIPGVVLLMKFIRWLFARSLADSVAIDEAQTIRLRIGMRVMSICYAAFAVLWLMATFLPLFSRPLNVPNARPLNWYEWATFGALVVGSSIVTVLIKRIGRPPRTNGAESRTAPPQSKTRVRFGLRDLLLSVALVSMLSAVVAAVMAGSVNLQWLGMLGTAFCLVVVTVNAACIVLFRRGWVYWALALPLTIAGATALHTWLLSDWMCMITIIWIREWPARVVAFSTAFTAFAAVEMIGIYLLLAAGALRRPEEPTVGSVSVQRAIRAVALCVCLFAYAPLFVVYWRTLATIPVPEYALPETNAYPRIASTVNRLADLTRSDTTVHQIRDPAKRKHVQEIYDSLMETLSEPAYVPLNMERDAHDEYYAEQMPLIQNIRALARAWEMESTFEQSRGQFDRAADFCLATIRLGTTQQKGGGAFSALSGISVEEVGGMELIRARRGVSIETARRLLKQLAEIDDNREPRLVSFAREAAWNDRTYTWRTSLAREAPVVLASVEHDDAEAHWVDLPNVWALGDAMDRRDARHRLLMADLAIRLYQHDRGRLPESLKQLTPDYLSAVPTDPYSKGPLVYRYSGESYTLYSIGQDGDDDGGKFGTVAEMYSASFDFDLDVYTRANPPSSARVETGEDKSP